MFQNYFSPIRIYFAVTEVPLSPQIKKTESTQFLRRSDCHHCGSGLCATAVRCSIRQRQDPSDTYHLKRKIGRQRHTPSRRATVSQSLQPRSVAIDLICASSCLLHLAVLLLSMFFHTSSQRRGLHCAWNCGWARQNRNHGPFRVFLRLVTGSWLAYVNGRNQEPIHRSVGHFLELSHA